MPTVIPQIKVFVSCPGDVEKEKQSVIEVCESLTRINAPYIQVKAIEWKKDVFPLITGEGAQSVINNQIKEDYDIYIGIFWKRFGDKSSNGLTPTEEEFEKAFKRYNDTRKPLISVYFKTDTSYPFTIPDTEQVLAFQKFQERIKGLGLYHEFKESEFQNKALEDIAWKIRNWASLTAMPVSKKTFDVIPNYLPRKITLAKEFSTAGFSFSLADSSKDTIDVIAQYDRIVLIGDAGAGKTTELERIKYHFSKSKSQVKPFFVSLNKYVNENIADLLGLGWASLPESQTLIILDGLDEIEAKNRNDAIRRIESFSEQHPSCKIIISCRKNFYKIEKKDESGTLSSFSSYVLLDLDDKDVKNYVQNRLGVQSEVFWKSILTKHLNTLLRIPFYLVSIVTLFLTRQEFPDNKAEIFEHLLNESIKFDSSHFRTTIELDENRKRISDTLTRLALGMELLERNYITNEEYEKLVPDTFLHSLLKHCTIWKKNEGISTTWQFEHNNFQEYLAARALSTKSLQAVQNIVSFAPDFKKVIPSWINTLSFLFNISNDPALYLWILESEPELAIKFEHSRIEDSVRIGIFKQIFEEYKEKDVWIPFDKYDYCELARFGQSEETIIYLLDEMESASHYTTRGNAIDILSYMDIIFNQKQRATQLLTKYSIEEENEQKRGSEEVQARALIALARLKLNSKEIVDTIVPILVSSTSDAVRFGLYYFLRKSDYLDEYIGVFLSGIKFVGFKVSANGNNRIAQSRLGEELWNLKLGLEKAKSPEALMKIIAHFIQNPSELENTSLSAILSPIAENAADAFSKEPKILGLATDLLSALVNEYHKEEIKNFVRFFDKTNMRLQVFEKLFSLRTESGSSMNVLSTLANKDCLEFIVQQFENNQIGDKEVWAFQNLLMLNNPDLYMPFNVLINRRSGNKFSLPPRRDFEKERVERRIKDIDLLFHRESFLEQFKLIFDREQKQTFTSDDAIKVMTRQWADQYFSDLAIHTLLQIAKKEPISINHLTQIVKSWDWSWFCISEMYEYFENNKDLSVTDEQRTQISEWCYSNLNKVDFRKALIPKPNRQFSTSYLAIYLWFFLRKFDLKYPPSVLLDMLSFDWIEGHQMVGIQYLGDRLSRFDVKKRILENLQNGIQIDDVLKNHFEYCRRNRIEECLPFALSEISNSGRDFGARKAALNVINEISHTVADLESAVAKISDGFKWDVVEQLVKHKSEYAHLFIRKILERGPEEEKIKAASYLIILQDLDGLKYYAQWVKQHKAIPERFLERSPLENLERLEAIPVLIELLKVSFERELKNDFPSLYGIVINTFSTIALKSESNYFEIKQAIEHFIKDYSGIEGINFLNSYLEDLEQRYYVTKGGKLNLDEAIKKLEDIWAS